MNTLYLIFFVWINTQDKIAMVSCVSELCDKIDEFVRNLKKADWEAAAIHLTTKEQQDTEYEYRLHRTRG